jgi:hypothetical protein
MRIHSAHAARLGALAAFALASCAHHAAKQTEAATPTAQQAYQQVAKDQQELAAATGSIQQAQRDQAAAQRQLAAAQQREQQARARVQQLQIKARQDAERASQLAQHAQAAAEQAQGLQTAEGRISEATPSRLVLETPGGRLVSFRVDSQTHVLVGSEQRSIAEIQQGADARVSYDPRGGEPTAVTVQVGGAAPQRR